MPRCYICRKGNMTNLQVSHAKNRTKKVRKPNLHSYKIKIGNLTKKVKMCTECLRKAKKEQVAQVAPKTSTKKEEKK